MVSTASLAAMLFTLLASFFLPIALAFYLYKKYSISIKALFMGAAVFILSQLLIRIPLINYLLGHDWFADLMDNNLFFSAVIIAGLTAGFFEECGRYLGFRFILKKELAWKNGLAYGLGHGGIEAMIVVGLAYINNIVLSLMINSGAFEQFAVPRLGAEAEIIRSQLAGLPPSIFLTAGVERILTLIIHIAFSMIVLYAVKRRRPLFLLLAIMLHTLLNALAVYLQAVGAGVWLIEIYIAVFAAAALYLIMRIKKVIDPPGADDPPETPGLLTE